MADNPDLAARLSRFVENGRRAQASAIRAGALAPTAAPGYRFALRDRVLDLVTGRPAFVTASYGAAASNARIYEVQLDDGTHGVRVEDQLEPAPARVAPSHP